MHVGGEEIIVNRSKLAFVVGVAILGLLLVAAPSVARGQHPIVGAWHMDAQGAPYGPHQMTFNEDGVVHMTNPTNVQEKGEVGTTDSVGMGMWWKTGHNRIAGLIYQENATQPTDVPAERLRVSFKCKVTGDTFRCNALATLEGLGGGPAVLVGERIKVNRADMRQIPEVR
jgi:hypothetical protein